MKECVLFERECTDCGECDKCDLDRTKNCDDCGKCIDTSEEYLVVDVNRFFEEN